MSMPVCEPAICAGRRAQHGRRDREALHELPSSRRIGIARDDLLKRPRALRRLERMQERRLEDGVHLLSMERATGLESANTSLGALPRLFAHDTSVLK